ncbi:restriction endonuclease subunit S [Novosphingobium olei]|uniref:restriction endonuclease subunit S n=1 Tax=Novosphingobium olei TaxID=2728851 RepID=UPI0030892D97|nr:restriction endonuclease subunit S [Novosphingobium olei]
MGWGEIEFRHDPAFYRASFRELTNKIERGSFATLGSVSVFSSEAWDQQSLFGDEFPYLEISSIDLVTGDIKMLDLVPVEEAASRARMIVHPNDLLVSMTRPSRGAIARAADHLPNPFIASTGFGVIRHVDTGRISADYLLLVLRSQISLRQMEQRSSGGNYPAITSTELKRIKLPIPSQTEQEALVAKYHNAIGVLKNARAEAAALLESIDDFLLSELDINLLPEIENTLINRKFRVAAADLSGWRFDPPVHQSKFSLESASLDSVPLGRICHINPRTSFGRLHDTDLAGFVPMDAISDRLGIVEYVDERRIEECSGYTTFCDNDVLWAKITPCMENGKSAVARDLTNGVGFGSTEFHVIRPRSTAVLPEYVHSLLRMGRLRREAKRFFTGSSGHRRVDDDFLKKLVVPLPPRSLQERLVQEIRAKRDQAIELEKSATAKLESAKREIEAILLGEAA